jgi:hypothetical protein
MGTWLDSHRVINGGRYSMHNLGSHGTWLDFHRAIHGGRYLIHNHGSMRRYDPQRFVFRPSFVRILSEFCPDFVRFILDDSRS